MLTGAPRFVYTTNDKLVVPRVSVSVPKYESGDDLKRCQEDSLPNMHGEPHYPVWGEGTRLAAETLAVSTSEAEMHIPFMAHGSRVAERRGGPALTRCRGRDGRDQFGYLPPERAGRATAPGRRGAVPDCQNPT